MSDLRVSGGIRPSTVVLLGGGRKAEDRGTWSATNEWLTRRLAPAFPELGFVEVRYRVKSWQRLELCVEDARAAIEAAAEGGAERVALVGFSMGGAVAVAAAEDPVTTVVGLAPWLPEKLTYDRLAGRRFAVVHGSLDRGLPGVPGVTAKSSRRGFELARERTREAEYTLIRGGLHGAAIRAPWGLTPLPRAGRWAALLSRELERFQTLGTGGASGASRR
jgi:dienelactone hydrolase